MYKDMRKGEKRIIKRKCNARQIFGCDGILATESTRGLVFAVVFDKPITKENITARNVMD